MPIYEYRCRICSAVTEVLVLTTDDEDNVKCDGCGSPKVEKLLSVAAIAVKHGSGDVPVCGRESACCDRDGRCHSMDVPHAELPCQQKV